MIKPRVAGPIAALVLVTALAVASPARAVLVTAGTGSGLAGQNVDIPITVDNTTGLGILSCQFDITYNPNVVTAIDVVQTGTLSATAGWQVPIFSVTSTGGVGRIRISDAGTTPLAGAGTLLVVRFTINPALINGSGTGLGVANALFNEGTPPATTASGSLTVNVTPQILVSPASGEVIRGQTLSFSVSGSVTNPVAWSTSDNAVATIGPTGLLTGVAPGSVTVTATDAAAHSNTTSGLVLVRGMGLTAGSASVLVGQTFSVPLTVTNLTGLGIHAGQITLTFNSTILTATGVTTPAGTLLNGYGTVGFGATSGSCTVDFAGLGSLGGTGVLCFVTFHASPTATGGSSLHVAQALFNEVLPAKPTDGSLLVSALPAIFVNPDVVSLLAGQTQQYTVSGSPTPPIGWSVVDPTIASITSGGLLTAVKGGITQVRAQDNVGAVDFSTSLTVYDFRVAPDTVTTLPGSVCVLRLRSDRLLGALAIHSLQYRLQWSSPYITAVVAQPQGLIADWGAANIISVPNLQGAGVSSETVVAAGSPVFSSGSRDVQWLEFTIAPGAPASLDIPISLVSLLCNEGSPLPQLANGLIRIRNTTDAPPSAGGSALALASPTPNPARSGAEVRFVLPESGDDGERVQLVVVGIDGRRVRTLVDGVLPAGPHAVAWKGKDESGGLAAPGLYFVRLQWNGESLTRKLAVVR